MIFWKGIIKNLIYFKKFILFFLLNPAPVMDKVIKNKGPGISDQPVLRLWNKFIKVSLLLIIWPGLMVFELFQKITPSNLCEPIHDLKNYSTFICPFESGKCGKVKITKSWIFWKWKELFRWNKKHFF